MELLLESPHKAMGRPPGLPRSETYTTNDSSWRKQGLHSLPGDAQTLPAMWGVWSPC